LVHEAPVKRAYKDGIVGHISRDATAIVAREKPVKVETHDPTPKRKRGRPKKGEVVAKPEPRRLAPTGPDPAPDAGRSSDAL
jgi:hypothetical protein